MTTLIEKFNVRLVNKNDKYGREWRLTHDENDPMVEFYDSRCLDSSTGLGQFVSRYYVSTMMEVEDGLNLDCGIDGWEISGDGVEKVKEFIKNNI
tara:strand:+ start:1620 stop:1904 length:285 start_codon:yes stop_codon:yes gene_type:complete